jgi:hypothetical protein
MPITDKENERYLRTLLMMLGEARRNHNCPHETLLESFRKAMDAVPGLEVAVDKHWSTLPEYDRAMSPFSLPWDTVFPQWLIEALIRKPEFLPIMKLFPYMVNSNCNECYTLKSDFLHLPLLSWGQSSLDRVAKNWYCENEEILAKFLTERYWLGLAEVFLQKFEDWRSDGFYRAMACFLVFQEEGGVLDPDVVYKIFERALVRPKSEGYFFYWPFMACTVGFVINLMRRTGWKSVQEMKFDDWYLKAELDRRIGETGDNDKALMGWLYDIIVNKNYKTRGVDIAQKLAEEEEDEAEEKRKAEAAEEEPSGKRQKVDAVEVAQ